MNDVTFVGSRADVFRFIAFLCKELSDQTDLVDRTGDEVLVQFSCVIKKEGEEK